MPEDNPVNWYHPTDEEIAGYRKNHSRIPDSVYTIVQQWSVTVTADFIVRRRHLCGFYEYLLVTRAERPWKGKPFVPGGRMLPLETPIDACIRNVTRELGFVPKAENISFVGTVPVLNPESQSGGGPWSSLWLLHIVDLQSGDIIRLDRTGVQAVWTPCIMSEYVEPVRQALALAGCK